MPCRVFDLVESCGREVDVGQRQVPALWVCDVGAELVTAGARRVSAEVRRWCQDEPVGVIAVFLKVGDAFAVCGGEGLESRREQLLIVRDDPIVRKVERGEEPNRDDPRDAVRASGGEDAGVDVPVEARVEVMERSRRCGERGHRRNHGVRPGRRGTDRVTVEGVSYSHGDACCHESWVPCGVAHERRDLDPARECGSGERLPGATARTKNDETDRGLGCCHVIDGIFGKLVTSTKPGAVVVGQISESARPERIHPACPTSAFPIQIGGKWTGMIIICLLYGPRRFSELRAALETVTPKVLTQTLRDMSRDGLLVRHDFAENPPHVEYELTPLGHSLMDVIEAARAWSDAHISELLNVRNL